MSTPSRTYWPARWPHQPRPTRIRTVAAWAVSDVVASMRPRRSVLLARGLTRSKKSCGTSGVVSRRATVLIVVMPTIVTVYPDQFSTHTGECVSNFCPLEIVSEHEREPATAAAAGTGACRHVGIPAVRGG